MEAREAREAKEASKERLSDDALRQFIAQIQPLVGIIEKAGGAPHG